MAKIKIAIDAGHGSKTAGKRTPPFTKDVDVDGDGKIDIKKGDQFREHYATVGIANLLYNKLSSRGFNVIKTGWDDTNSKNDSDVSLSLRQQKIKKAGCDYSISIHFNAFGDGTSFNSGKGVGVYIHSLYPGDSKKLANYVLQELAKGTPQNNRGIHKEKLALCNCKTMNTKASIICELAFMTNEKEAMELMGNSRFWEECAEEIADAVTRYCDIDNSTGENSNDSVKVYHTVVAGETLSQIALKHDTTVKRLQKINKIEDPDLINVGQKILLSEYIKYTVIKGDTLSEISQKFLGNANRYDEIKKYNNLKSDVINVNDVLKIPIN